MSRTRLNGNGLITVMRGLFNRAVEDGRRMTNLKFLMPPEAYEAYLDALGGVRTIDSSGITMFKGIPCHRYGGPMLTLIEVLGELDMPRVATLAAEGAIQEWGIRAGERLRARYDGTNGEEGQADNAQPDEEETSEVIATNGGTRLTRVGKKHVDAFAKALKGL